MSDAAWMSVPTGRRLESTDRPQNYVGTMRVLARADTDNIAFAERHWLRANEEDFAREGRRWVDKANGAAYQRVRSNPLLGDPKAAGVAIFVVADDCMIFLRREDQPEPAERVFIGEVGCRQAGPGDRPPVPHPEAGSIW